MPLKYMFQIPEPVKYLGWLHGVLFVLYALLLLKVFLVAKWTFLKILIAFLVSFVPFRWLDYKLAKEIAENK